MCKTVKTNRAISIERTTYPRRVNSMPLSSSQLLLFLPLIATVPDLLLKAVTAGSCREAQLCCNGRDSTCVVQKAPTSAINEDLIDKPCYCDHACLKLGDCCEDFKEQCRVLDCQVSDWGQWSGCDKSCGTGMMSRSRKVLQAAENGGKHCPLLVQKRSCQGFLCHGYSDKKILREIALLLPATLSHNRHPNGSNGIVRRNYSLRYPNAHKHNGEHENSSKMVARNDPIPAFKLLLVGDGYTGKTAYLRHLITGENVSLYNPTVGVERGDLILDTNRGPICLNIWDFAGQQRNQDLDEDFFVQPDCVIIMFDVRNCSSLHHVKRWHRSLRLDSHLVPLAVCGNKLDNELDRDRSRRRALRFLGRELRWTEHEYFDISVRKNYNLTKPLVYLMQQVLNDPDLELIGPLVEGTLDN